MANTKPRTIKQRIATYHNWQIGCIRGLISQLITRCQKAGLNKEAAMIASIEQKLLAINQAERKQKLEKVTP